MKHGNPATLSVTRGMMTVTARSTLGGDEQVLRVENLRNIQRFPPLSQSVSQSASQSASYSAGKHNDYREMSKQLSLREAHAFIFSTRLPACLPCVFPLSRGEAKNEEWNRFPPISGWLPIVDSTLYIDILHRSPSIYYVSGFFKFKKNRRGRTPTNSTRSTFTGLRKTKHFCLLGQSDSACLDDMCHLRYWPKFG